MSTRTKVGVAALLALLILAGLYFIAHVHRYEVVNDRGPGVIVWDRWTHEACLMIPNRETICSGVSESDGSDARTSGSRPDSQDRDGREALESFAREFGLDPDSVLDQ